MNGIQTVGRALEILSVIAEAGTTLSVSEIAERVGIPESTTYRLLQTLEQNCVVERKAKGQIALGLKILDLARSLYQQMDRELCMITRPVMEQLTAKTEETTVLMVRTGLNIVCIQNVESQRLIRFALENGRVLPLHTSASGKSILAFENGKVIEQVLHSMNDRERKENLVAELERIRQQGYSITVGEADKDVFGIGAPIYDAYGRVMASLTLAGPVDRLKEENKKELVKEILNAARGISDKLGVR